MDLAFREDMPTTWVPGGVAAETEPKVGSDKGLGIGRLPS